MSGVPPVEVLDERPPPKKGKGFFSLIAIVGILGCVLMTSVGLSAAGGAWAGQRQRNAYITQTVSTSLDDQYAAALQDIERGAYDLAAQRIQYVLGVDPDYPGAEAQLSTIAREQNLRSTPLPEENTPLPPSSAENPEELYTEAESLFNDGDWAGAITRFEELQALFPDYQRTTVLSQLYEARVNLGLSYIRGDRLQEGIVLLEQAGDIQRLDDRTAGELRLANLYLNGLTYWGFNWRTVTQNLLIIYQTAPDYKDVANRLVTAYANFGRELSASGNYCDAVEQFEAARQLDVNNADVATLQEELADEQREAERFCDDPDLVPTVESTPGSDGITLTPTPGETATPTLTPTPTPATGDIP
jgi:tetratricopeptide (TPR) repeat protein